MVNVLVEALPPAPGPRAGITITGLGIGDSLVTVWRSCDGAREAVPGYRREVMNDAAFITDYYVPVNRPVTYEVEVLSGPGGASRTTSAPVTVESSSGWLMDPLIPQTAIPIVGERRSTEDVTIRDSAFSSMEYKGDVGLFPIMGTDRPMALFGQRMAETGMDISVSTRSADENRRLKKLLRATTSLHFRPLPEWGDLELEGSLFLASAAVRQLPANIMIGGNLTWWDLPVDTVQAPAMKVLTATYSYGDVDILMATYQQKQDLMAGRTYLDDLKYPMGG